MFRQIGASRFHVYGRKVCFASGNVDVFGGFGRLDQLDEIAPAWSCSSCRNGSISTNEIAPCGCFGDAAEKKE